ncbi:EamA domain-containing membrane protein RarD [Oryzisolibacter propanilivorax]|uniref:EamA domain-containing membrane protein RarD n=1 Tax=Oryzisolibacter propanilivorax TaxID=1527607 RepID=A0A1G9QBV5_9BURK|nr:DMT family transporter [Oryzisolibacter propanilivorax]SDM07845.1 EamA domain-containing membrane protein RarD [Oryzisolibacter propanilivorax]
MKSPLPVLALLFNTLIWGLAWWPFKHMLGAGLHPLWATALMYAAIVLVLTALRPQVWRQALGVPALLLLALNAGINNVAFNWAIGIGDVVRVVLVFYLMPAWAVLLAWRILGERPTPAALARLALAFAGVLLVLWPAEGGVQRLAGALGLADGLALLGGFTFALNNVLLRRMYQVPGQARMLAMFAGCMAMALLAALAGQPLGLVTPLPAFDPAWALPAAALALALMAGNWALQYGAARLAAGTTALVMLTEVVIAAGSSMLAGASQPSWRTLVGGLLVMSAALAAARRD